MSATSLGSGEVGGWQVQGHELQLHLGHCFLFCQIEITATNLSPGKNSYGICYQSDSSQLTAGIREGGGCYIAGLSDPTGQHCIYFKGSESKRTQPQIPEERGGGPVHAAFSGKLSPALARQEPSYLPSRALETEAGVHSLLRARSFLELNVLALRPDSEQGLHEWKE